MSPRGRLLVPPRCVREGWSSCPYRPSLPQSFSWLLGFTVFPVGTAAYTEFALYHPVWIILLVLGCHIITRLAFGTCKRDDDAVLFAFGRHPRYPPPFCAPLLEYSIAFGTLCLPLMSSSGPFTLFF